MMNAFDYISSPHKVNFGKGMLQTALLPMLKELGVAAPAILSTPEQRDLAATTRDIIGTGVACVFTEATMHTPTHVTEKALSAIKKHGADGIIAIGGGSTIGLGKALSIRTGLPHLCIPTTYAGSEMTPILGETEDGRKKTRRDSKILPNAIIYDVKLTTSLPLKLSLHSGINAIAHSIEALYAENRNPIIELLACESIRAIAEALPILKENLQDEEARYKALYGAWLAGYCLGSADMGLHHKLCHTLGGTYNLPHAETHVMVLPHAVAYNMPACPVAMQELAASLPDSNGDALTGLNALYDRLGISSGLRDLGMEEGGISEAAELAVAHPYKNPQPLELASIHEVIRRAWAGERASSL